MEGFGGAKSICILIPWLFYAGIGNPVVEYKNCKQTPLDSALSLPLRESVYVVDIVRHRISVQE